MAAGRSPSGVENAYAAAVASKKNLAGREINKSCYNKAEVETLQCKENEDFRPDTGGACQGIGTESLECSENDQDGRPSVVKRKRKMDE